MKKLILIGVFLSFFLLNVSFFELKESKLNDEINSMIGLTIDGSSTTTFPTKDSGLAIGSIICDKGANGVWDYQSWTLKIRNITQSRTKCQINFVSRYTENILNGTDPVLKDGLIPVTIDNDGVVKKASLGSEWYDYETRRWANAVILNNETEVYYDGEVIPEEAIESYFVWIPRYKYKIFDMGNYEGLTNIENKTQTIEVVFGTETTTDTSSSCKTPNQSGASGTCSVGKYMTHPAFTAFDTESNIIKGIWVGKFETGYKGTTNKSEAEKNENSPSKVQIKPNVYSWRNIQVSNAYLSSDAYQREMDSHMMKNTEWGAVAYLQHSQYGSGTSVRINNHSDYKTGYSGIHKSTCGYTGKNEECNKYGTTDDITKSWNTDIGVLASTTGNISGIYDMSGGSWEYVMGVMLDSTNTTLCSGYDANYNSGFNGSYCNTTGSKTDGINYPNSKYYDSYVYGTTITDNKRRILGDATGELGPFSNKSSNTVSVQISSWYENESSFALYSRPWFLHGGRYDRGTGSGIFAYNLHNGVGEKDISFRLVLAPEKEN